jgi:KUP system potassium uptake protein
MNESQSAASIHQPAPQSSAAPEQSQHGDHHLPTLILGAIGVVFGDIGTSPLYALKECFREERGLQLSTANVYGILSVLVWAMTMVVSIKYVAFIMRADNRGEGGILAMLALILRKYQAKGRLRWTLISLGLFGTAMFYGDSMITPAISVLSAVEGLEIAAPLLHHVIVPVTIAILTGLFLIQRHGTGSVGIWFGPLTCIWFATLAVLGVVQIAQAPAILGALNPLHALRFLIANPWLGFVLFGSVFLVLTGAEALYTDMGHFGRRPIRIAWFSFVMPALLLNYFGQGALVLANPAAIKNPFYLLAPPWALVPLVILATIATVIASQAVISGAFSLTSQAIKLGYCPRMQILYTSSKEIGQIYLPFINWTLFVAVILLVLGFGSSGALANAYGIAVATTMTIDSFLFFILARLVWNWRLPWALLLAGAFGVVDLVLLGSNSLKILQGGWFPLLIGAVCYLLLVTWRRGRVILFKNMTEGGLPLDAFVQSLSYDMPQRVEGTSIFMTSNPAAVPHAMLHNLKHNKVLHQRVVFLTVITSEVPFVSPWERLKVVELGEGFYRVEARYGFKDEPDVNEITEICEQQHGMKFELMETSFFLARETVIPSKVPGMPMWQEQLFAWMFRNATRATDYFRIPPNRVVELGTQVEI